MYKIVPAIDSKGICLMINVFPCSSQADRHYLNRTTTKHAQIYEDIQLIEMGATFLTNSKKWITVEMAWFRVEGFYGRDVSINIAAMNRFISHLQRWVIRVTAPVVHCVGGAPWTLWIVIQHIRDNNYVRTEKCLADGLSSTR
jgi:hypothetical protein